jgi:hypothetical protein
MDTAKSIIVISTAIVIFMGQLLRLDIAGISFPLIDLFTFLLFLTTDKSKITNKPFFIFIIFAWISLAINHFFGLGTTPSAWMYLIRLTLLIGLIIYPPKLQPIAKNILLLSLLANIIFGLIQYYFWPDFTYFKSLDWDDHLNRLVSTYFDPTFTGLIYLMFFLYLYFNFPRYSPLVLVPIALTYSRSTFLSLLICLVFVFFKTKKFLSLVLCFVFCVLILLLPRPAGEGTKLERTSSINAKIVNYQQALDTFVKSPIIGHGYNNLALVRHTGSVSRSGFDSSLLTILTTTGIIGFILFALGLFKLFKQSSLLKQTMLIAIIIHSLFANSLLYPWVILIFVLF